MSYQSCLRCGRNGHSQKNCLKQCINCWKDLTNFYSQISKMCEQCDQENHFCYKCNKKGHLASECSKTCFQCGESDSKLVKQNSKWCCQNCVSCQKCHKSGHFYKQCKEKCKKCQLSGPSIGNFINNRCKRCRECKTCFTDGCPEKKCISKCEKCGKGERRLAEKEGKMLCSECYNRCLRCKKTGHTAENCQTKCTFCKSQNARIIHPKIKQMGIYQDGGCSDCRCKNENCGQNHITEKCQEQCIICDLKVEKGYYLDKDGLCGYCDKFISCNRCPYGTGRGHTRNNCPKKCHKCEEYKIDRNKNLYFIEGTEKLGCQNCYPDKCQKCKQFGHTKNECWIYCTFCKKQNNCDLKKLLGKDNKKYACANYQGCSCQHCGSHKNHNPCKNTCENQDCEFKNDKKINLLQNPVTKKFYCANGQGCNANIYRNIQSKSVKNEILQSNQFQDVKINMMKQEKAGVQIKTTLKRNISLKEGWEEPIAIKIDKKESKPTKEGQQEKHSKKTPKKITSQKNNQGFQYVIKQEQKELQSPGNSVISTRSLSKENNPQIQLNQQVDSLVKNIVKCALDSEGENNVLSNQQESQQTQLIEQQNLQQQVQIIEQQHSQPYQEPQFIENRDEVLVMQPQEKMGIFHQPEKLKFQEQEELKKKKDDPFDIDKDGVFNKLIHCKRCNKRLHPEIDRDHVRFCPEICDKKCKFYRDQTVQLVFKDCKYFCALGQGCNQPYCKKCTCYNHKYEECPKICSKNTPSCEGVQYLMAIEDGADIEFQCFQGYGCKDDSNRQKNKVRGINENPEKCNIFQYDSINEEEEECQPNCPKLHIYKDICDKYKGDIKNCKNHGCTLLHINRIQYEPPVNESTYEKANKAAYESLKPIFLQIVKLDNDELVSQKEFIEVQIEEQKKLFKEKGWKLSNIIQEQKKVFEIQNKWDNHDGSQHWTQTGRRINKNY